MNGSRCVPALETVGGHGSLAVHECRIVIRAVGGRVVLQHWTAAVSSRIGVVSWHPRRGRHPLVRADRTVRTRLSPSVAAKGMMLWWSIFHHFFDMHPARLQYLWGRPRDLNNTWGTIWHVLLDVAPHAEPVCNPFDRLSPAPNDPTYQVWRTLHLVGSSIREVSWSMSYRTLEWVRRGHASSDHLRTLHVPGRISQRDGCGLWWHSWSFLHVWALDRCVFHLYVSFRVFLDVSFGDVARSAPHTEGKRVRDISERRSASVPSVSHPLFLRLFPVRSFSFARLLVRFFLSSFVVLRLVSTSIHGIPIVFFFPFAHLLHLTCWFFSSWTGECWTMVDGVAASMSSTHHV